MLLLAVPSWCYHLRLGQGTYTSLVVEDGSWTNWHVDITTFTPISHPTTDEDLPRINKSKDAWLYHPYDGGGAASSPDGIAMQCTEEDTAVISLASHSTQVDEWQDSIEPLASTIRIGAGKLWFDVSVLTRLRGFVLNSRSAGAYFDRSI